MSISDTNYTRTAVALHWLVAALVIAQIVWGWWMQGIPKQPVGPRVDAFNLHKSTGMVILALMLVRVGWRIGHPPAPLAPMRRWRQIAAHTSHMLLYVALIAQPLIGYLGSVWSGYPVRIFGVVFPTWGERNLALQDAMRNAHLIVAAVLMATIALHVAAALHHAALRDGVLRRMLPHSH